MAVILASIGALATLLLGGSARAATPTVTMFPDGMPSAGTSFGITPASDGKIWFTSYGSHDALGVIDPANPVAGVVKVDITGNGHSEPWSVLNGPDGNVFFGTRFGNGIGEVVPATGAGANSPVYLGNPNYIQPFTAATSSTGQIWVTGAAEPEGGTAPPPTSIPAADKIGIVTPGVPPSYVNETTLPQTADPFGIAIGPGDQTGTAGPSFWVPEFGGNRIARLIPTFPGPALTTEFLPLPTTNSQPYLIALGPDGNMWFTEFGANKIGRFAPPANLSTGLSIQEFTLPSGSQPQGIAAGPDGSMWIAATGRGSILRMNMAGEVTGEYPTSASPNGIAPGSDGNLWFTTYQSDLIGRITSGLDQPAFRNTSAIPIPLVGAPNTPASIDVSGLQGTITDVNVRLTGISHTFPDDMDVILQSPTGQTALVMSDVGSGLSSQTSGTKQSYPADGITLTLDDQASRSLSDTDPLVSGIYKPTNVTDPNESTTEGNAPGPFSTSFPSALNTFNGASPNGTWKLWVNDDNLNVKDTASKLYGGWGLDISTTGPPASTQQPPPAATPAPAPTAKKCKKKRKTAFVAKKCKKKR
ncbi:MAG TPA: hypothetical protein VFY30_06195 [Solirubrobacterales bacterium]|nr:hypothetical protein [Solirubrobacterales bacterium]